MSTSTPEHAEQSQPAPIEPIIEPGSKLMSPAAWRRLISVMGLVREMSAQTDPQRMTELYGERVRRMNGVEGFVSVSKRGMPPGRVRVTRFSGWGDDAPDAWREQHRHPVLTEGLLKRWLDGGAPVLINDFQCPADDPSLPYLAGARSLSAIPQYDGGEALNMIVVFRSGPDGFEPDQFPETVWTSNLFGRATSNLVLARRLEEANAALDREMRTVAEMQRALLPRAFPDVPGVRFAAHYQTSKNAGGDYYDFFERPDGKLGVLIADVSGHGTPAAVLMAIIHAIAHLSPDRSYPPAEMLRHLNTQLCLRYTTQEGVQGMFATAFYATLDPATGRVEYSSAGHPPPRLRVGFTGEGGAVVALDRAQGLPLGILDDAAYTQSDVLVEPGDALVMYTDGITETFGGQPDAQGGAGGAGGAGRPLKRDLFGTDRLDAVMSRRHGSPEALMRAVLVAVEEFAAGAPPADDRTILVASMEG